MSLIQIFAILSLLTSFGVDAKTVANIHDILIPVEASTTPVTIVPVIQTPVVQDQPIYFGGTVPTVVNPVNNTPTVVAPVVQSVVMDKSGVFVKDISQTTYDRIDMMKNPDAHFINIQVRDTNGEIIVQGNTGTHYVNIYVDGILIENRSLNQYGGINFAHDFTSPTSIIGVEYNGTVHNFTLDSI